MKTPIRTIIVVSVIILLAPKCSFSALYTINTDRAAYWNDRFWFSERMPKKCEGLLCERGHKIYSYDINSKEPPRLEFQIKLPVRSFWMVGDTDRLWLISDETTGYFNGEKYLQVETDEMPADFTRPFIFHGFPTVIEHKSKDCILKSFSEDAWQELSSFKLVHDNDDDADEFLETIVIGDDLHLFLSNKGGIYHHIGIPDEEHAECKKWEPVTDYSGYWVTADIGGKPSVFYSVGSFLWGGIEGFVLTENGWENIYRSANSIFAGERSFGVFPIVGNKFLVFHETMYRAKGIVVDGDKVVSSFRIGEVSVLGAMLFFELLLIFILIGGLVVIMLNPFWAYRYAITQYSEAREYPIAEVNVHDIMSRDYSKTKSYVIKPRPEHKALTIRPKFSQRLTPGGGMKAISLSIMYFEESAGKVKIKLVSKLPNFLLLIFLSLFLVFIPLLSNTYGIDSKGNMLVYITLMMFFVVVPVALLFQVRMGKKQFKEFFDLILVYFGVEEKKEIEKLL
ncbi:MAG TPA: hypothetical protein PKH33_16925 [bacterium]|nr:hypothetical protein [bacterium]